MPVEIITTNNKDFFPRVLVTLHDSIIYLS